MSDFVDCTKKVLTTVKSGWGLESGEGRRQEKGRKEVCKIKKNKFKLQKELLILHPISYAVAVVVFELSSEFSFECLLSKLEL